MLYSVGLLSNYAASTLLKFKYCYHKCIKMFVDTQSHSITSLLLDLKLPSFNQLIHSCRYRYHMHLSTSINVVVSGALKLQELTMQEWTLTEEVAGVDIAGVDIDGGSCSGGLCRSGH